MERDRLLQMINDVFKGMLLNRDGHRGGQRDRRREGEVKVAFRGSLEDQTGLKKSVCIRLETSDMQRKLQIHVYSLGNRFPSISPSLAVSPQTVSIIKSYTLLGNGAEIGF